MEETLPQLGEMIATDLLPAILRSIAWIVLGLPLVFALSRFGNRYFRRKLTPQHGMVIGKAILLGGLILIVVSVFMEMKFKLTPLLGAAGVVGIAFGFASQTSLSNLISGLFLISERHFQVGDVLTIGTTTGEVLSIDLMSVKLRTFDNKYVRIPNENLIKSEATNITHFPIRRVDLLISVAYRSDIAHVRRVLMQVAERNPICLMEPAQLIIFQGFGASSLDFLFAVWAEKTEFLALRNALYEEIKTAFDAEDIEIPFPHLSLYAGSASQPLAINLQQTAPQPDSAEESKS